MQAKVTFSISKLKCYGKLEILDFKGVVPNNNRHFDEGLL